MHHIYINLIYTIQSAWYSLADTCITKYSNSMHNSNCYDNTVCIPGLNCHDQIKLWQQSQMSVITKHNIMELMTFFSAYGSINLPGMMQQKQLLVQFLQNHLHQITEDTLVEDF